MTRIRSKPEHPRAYTINGTNVSLGQVPSERMHDNRRPGPCEHSKWTYYSGPWVQDSAGFYNVSHYDVLGDYSAILSRAQQEVSSFGLNRAKLNSTNEFGMLQFFAELDDSLMLFTKKFYKEFTYGSFTWGVLPFVSEMKKLLEFIVKAQKDNGKSQKYEDRMVGRASGETTGSHGGRMKVDVKIALQHTGNIVIPNGSDASLWLDRLGFHPDINTAWDLLPLSFMVDWFLPVGDYINSLKASGWLREVYFTGWYTHKISITGEFIGHVNDSNSTSKFLALGGVGSLTTFIRHYVSQPISIKEKAPPTLEDVAGKFIDNPDQEKQLEQLFNTAYLMFSKKL